MGRMRYCLVGEARFLDDKHGIVTEHDTVEAAHVALREWKARVRRRYGSAASAALGFDEHILSGMWVEPFFDLAASELQKARPRNTRALQGLTTH